MLLTLRRRNFSTQILVQWLLAVVLLLALIIWQLPLLRQFYVVRDAGAIGRVVNGFIAALFVIGMARIAFLLLVYRKEEAELGRFAQNAQRASTELEHDIDTNSLIYGRLETVKRLASHGEVDQGSLASVAVASQSMSLSFARFLNSVFILVGMLGTIASLALALTGASDLLENLVNTGGMSVIVSGMSMALSTTLTAIVCYLVFGYFYQRLLDVQTHVLHQLEHLTTTEIIPRLERTPASLVTQLQALVTSLHETTKRVSLMQNDFAEQVGAALANFERERNANLEQRLDSINRSLVAGFRLSPSEPKRLAKNGETHG